MAIHVKKGDKVKIIAGDHKGAEGTVLSVNAATGKVKVQGHNLAKKHVKPSRQNPQGGRISVEQPIHISNVLPVNPKTGKATRVRFSTDAKGKKIRQAVDGTEIAVVARAKT
jgi:large subunit ribosomal protein L24